MGQDALPVWAQIVITIFATIVVASPFAVVLYNRLNKAIPQFAAAVQTINPKLDENSDLLKKLVDDRANQDQFTQVLVKRLWDTIDNYKSSIGALQENVTALQLNARDRETKSAENKRLIEDLTNESILNQKERKDLIAQVDRLQKDSDAMQRSLSEAQTKLNDTEKKLADTQAELEKAKVRIAQLESERADTVAEKERLTKELEDERAKVTELQKKVADLEQQVAGLKAELEAKNAVTADPPKEPSAI